MNKFKKIFLIIVFLLSIVLLSLIFSSGCFKTEPAFSDETSPENKSADAISEDVQVSFEDAEETDGDTGSITVESIEDNQEIQNNEILVFKGNKVNGNTASLAIEVNTETNEVKGVLQMGFQGFDMDGGTTKVCSYVLTGSITGNLDPETLKITGVLNGYVKSYTENQDCSDYNVNYAIIADIFEDFTKIKGYFDTKSMDNYDFFLNKAVE